MAHQISGLRMSPQPLPAQVDLHPLILIELVPKSSGVAIVAGMVGGTTTPQMSPSWMLDTEGS